ncbi:MAG: hypothetical protein Tp138OMZ00d2C19078241_45 [Prokaryotic dsDNA virus sp.]|jgi:hypothetical protein|nr:MAG: hypothetical protein Tp138OMZ00d2C19078241_45 [Prokaryotic dsDNA virus sp.]|tara:strand:- start:3187 stop:3513 length:327 start_codon:yes stop_codon:yes gene_type:complete
MGGQDYRKISTETKIKVLKMAATILEMHGVAVGARICQDWSGDEELSPGAVFTKAERDSLSFNYEQKNSGGDDYIAGFDAMSDEMVASFTIADAIDRMAVELASREGE